MASCCQERQEISAAHLPVAPVIPKPLAMLRSLSARTDCVLQITVPLLIRERIFFTPKAPSVGLQFHLHSTLYSLFAAAEAHPLFRVGKQVGDEASVHNGKHHRAHQLLLPDLSGKLDQNVLMTSL